MTIRKKIPEPIFPSDEPINAELELHFAAGHYHERNLPYYPGLLKERCVITTSDRSLLMRRLNSYLIFRDKESPVSSDAFYLLKRYDPARPFRELPFDEIAADIEAGQYGRCLVYVDERMQADECLYLFFHADGTGEALELAKGFVNWGRDYRTTAQLKFNWQKHAELITGNINQLSYDELLPLCQLLFQQQINPLLPDSFITPAEAIDISSAWLKGSETQLRALTQAICYTEPGLFDEQQTVRIFYFAAQPGKRGGLQAVIRNREVIQSRRLMSLCDLAFRLNQFTGLRWQVMRNNGPANRQSHFAKTLDKVMIELSPPSMHERADAMLTLIDWLDAQLHDEDKKKRLLGNI
jgi:hypothetical protein